MRMCVVFLHVRTPDTEVRNEHHRVFVFLKANDYDDTEETDVAAPSLSVLLLVTVCNSSSSWCDCAVDGVVQIQELTDQKTWKDS